MVCSRRLRNPDIYQRCENFLNLFQGIHEDLYDFFCYSFEPLLENWFSFSKEQAKEETEKILYECDTIAELGDVFVNLEDFKREIEMQENVFCPDDLLELEKDLSDFKKSIATSLAVVVATSEEFLEREMSDKEMNCIFRTYRIIRDCC